MVAVAASIGREFRVLGLLGAGHFLVIAGLTIIVLGTRRKPEEAFLRVEREAGRR